jgi:hypothetical protein
MHFDIARLPNPGLSEHHECSGWVISHDLGWTLDSHVGKQVLHKGLHDNRCAIVVDHTGWSIDTPSNRSFPLWKSKDGDRVANCVALDERIHNFNQVSHSEGSLHVSWSPPDWLTAVGQGLSSMTTRGILDKVCAALVDQAQSLDSMDLPIRAASTGGVDTAVVRAALDHAGVKYTLVDQTTQHKSPNHQYVWDNNERAGGNFWGYDQLANTEEPHIQATGFWGDEWMQRNPLYVSMYLHQHGRDIAHEFDSVLGEAYMTRFFDQEYRDKIQSFDHTADPMQKMIDMMTNDFQMWHMDECLTWTPLHSPEVFQFLLRLPPEAAIAQCLHADFSRQLIQMLNPKLLKSLNRHKNNR